MEKFILSAFADEIDKELDTQTQVLESHGIKHIELRGIDGKNVSDFTLEYAKQIKETLDSRGFKVSAIGSPIGKIGINDDFKKHMELFKHLLDIAKIMETKYIRIFSFYYPEGSSPEEHRGEVIYKLRTLTTLAMENGIILLHENEKDIYGDTPERCLDILESVNSPNLKATFDPANFIQCHVKPYPDAYNMLKEHIEYIHVKDALEDGGNVVPAGLGDGDFPSMIQDLDKSGFKGFLSLEPHLGSFEGLEKLEKDVKVRKIKKGGPESFEVAANALKEILDDLKIKYS